MTVSGFKAREATNYDIAIVMIPGETLTLRFLYNAARYEKESVSRIMNHLASLIERIPESGHDAIDNLEIMDAGEKNRLLDKFNDTAADFPADRCPYQLFEEQVEKTPDNTAVSFEERSLTYREFNKRVNQLAHYLRKNGVKKESKVGLLVERSLDMLIGILGIQKAGGSYVPMDP